MSVTLTYTTEIVIIGWYLKYIYLANGLNKNMAGTRNQYDGKKKKTGWETRKAEIMLA